MRRYFSWKIVIPLLALLLIGSGSYLVANTVFKPEPSQPTESIGFENVEKDATESAKKPTEPTKKKETASNESKEEVKGTTSQDNLPSYKITQPNNSRDGQGVDQAKLDAIYAALNQAADQKAKAYIHSEDLIKFQKLQLDCHDNIYSNPDNDILTPSQKQALVKSCEEGYQSTIDYYQKLVDDANALYNQYYQQALQIYSQCPSCSKYIKF